MLPLHRKKRSPLHPPDAIGSTPIYLGIYSVKYCTKLHHHYHARCRYARTFQLPRAMARARAETRSKIILFEEYEWILFCTVKRLVVVVVKGGGGNRKGLSEENEGFL